MRLNATEKKMVIPLAVAAVMVIALTAGLLVKSSTIGNLEGENAALRTALSECQPGALESLGVMLGDRARESIDQLEDRLHE